MSGDTTSWFRAHPLEWLDVGTAEIAYRTIGSGPPLLLLHGWPFSSLTFRKLVPVLSRHFTCILPDTPGLGETRWGHATSFAFGEQVATMQRFVARLDLAGACVLAHDTGGTLARLLALRDPERYSHLVLLDTEIPGHRPPWVPFFQRLAAVPGVIGAFRWLLGSPAFQRSSMAYGTCFHDFALLDDDFHACFIAPLLASPHAVDGALRYVRGIDWHLVDGLVHRHRELRARVRLVWSVDDPVFPLARARAMLPQFEGRADLVEVPAARFLVHEEQSAAVAAAALAFYER